MPTGPGFLMRPLLNGATLGRREKLEGWKCFRVGSFRGATGRVVAQTAEVDAVPSARSRPQAGSSWRAPSPPGALIDWLARDKLRACSRFRSRFVASASGSQGSLRVAQALLGSARALPSGAACNLVACFA